MEFGRVFYVAAIFDQERGFINDLSWRLKKASFFMQLMGGGRVKLTVLRETAQLLPI